MTDWQDVILSEDVSMQEAISVLDRSGLRIILIVDESNKLLGTVTDGDFRRAMLKKVDFTAPVSVIMNRNPKTLKAPYDSIECKHIMHENRLLQLPIIDNNGIVVELVLHDDIQEKEKYENAVFIMAGGFGKRLYPLTREMPKPMLLVGGKPILEHIIINCRDAGFSRFFISTHFMPEVIRDYFQDGKNWNVEISYVYEQEPLGTGGALGLLPISEIKSPILMMNGDILTSVDLASLRKFHSDNSAIATVCVSEYENQVPFGVIENREHEIIGITEKPIFRFFVNSGIYFLDPAFIQAVAPDERVDMPSLIKKVIAEGETVNMFPLLEDWSDIGRHEDLKNANEMSKNTEHSK